jgi:acyl carrier protein
MTENEFIAEIAEIIETDVKDLTCESDFRKSADYWSSLTGFCILVFLQDKCDTPMPVEDFLEMNTIAELYHATKKDK